GWLRAGRDTLPRHIETPPRRAAESQTQKHVVEQRQRRESTVNEKLGEDDSPASASEINEFTWSFRGRTARVSPVKIFDAFVTTGSSFDDRFAAAFEVSAISQPSIIQRLMDRVGAIP